MGIQGAARWRSRLENTAAWVSSEKQLHNPLSRFPICCSLSSRTGWVGCMACVSVQPGGGETNSIRGIPYSTLHGTFMHKLHSLLALDTVREVAGLADLHPYWCSQVEVKLEGAGPWKLPGGSEDIDLIFTPGHSVGHVALHYKPDRVLFSGDHFGWSVWEERGSMNRCAPFLMQGSPAIFPYYASSAWSASHSNLPSSFGPASACSKPVKCRSLFQCLGLPTSMVSPVTNTTESLTYICTHTVHAEGHDGNGRMFKAWRYMISSRLCQHCPESTVLTLLC